MTAASTPRRIIILLGMPGVGKGTQAQFIAETYHLNHIDTGQALRAEIALVSELGKQAQSYMNQGQLVPLPVVMEVIKAAIVRTSDTQAGILFDGFPRNAEQAEQLAQIAQDLSLCIDQVLYLETPQAILMDRLAYRQTCSQCDAKYNSKLHPPKQPGLCDTCHTPLTTRPDDRPEVIENRLKAYETETAPLIAYYEAQGLLKRINANQSMETVFRDIRQGLTPLFQSAGPVGA